MGGRSLSLLDHTGPTAACKRARAAVVDTSSRLIPIRRPDRMNSWILTAVAYQIMVSGTLPQLSSVTFMNAFLSFSFLIISATVVENLIVGAYDLMGDPKRGDRCDRRCRKAFRCVCRLDTPCGIGHVRVVLTPDPARCCSA